MSQQRAVRVAEDDTENVVERLNGPFDVETQWPIWHPRLVPTCATAAARLDPY